ncbi:SRPBCC family protein [Lentzea sp. CA-135723]|uniref:SRPBCC family protein n=1 Tax=Lentzea sp. CA-135723 TaxID=3239950 RepID=UPI003D949199
MARRIVKEVEVEAPLEQVWQAISSGPGFATWYVPHAIEPTPGGLVRTDFGPAGVREGVVLDAAPPQRLVYGGFGEPEDPVYCYEFLLAAQGGHTSFRLVQNGFLDGERWDQEYDALDAGWDLFLHNLILYQRHFAGLPASLAMAMTRSAGGEEWGRLLAALRVPARCAVGDRVVINVPGVDLVEGVVDFLNPGRHLGVRTACGLHRFSAEGVELCGVSVYQYRYGTPLPPDAAACWQRWLDARFA